jgi:hypothetical protein
MSWVNSQGKAAPKKTGEAESKSQKDELFEASKARQEMKPVLIFFAKSRDVLSFGKKTKDRQVEATTYFEKEIFRRLVVTNLAKNFVNIKVDVRKGDKKLLAKTYRLRRAPLIVILDLYSKQIYRLSSPKLSWRTLAKVMETAIGKVEKEVKRLATTSKEDTPLVKRAKTRYAEITMRDDVDKGLQLAYDKKWAQAEKTLKGVLDRKEENQYKKAAENGMKEIKAGKLYQEGYLAQKKKRYQQSKELLDQVIKIRESKYFKQLATELLKKVNKKLAKKR